MNQFIDVAWIIIAAALILVMQGGFCALESGYVRARNNVNVAANGCARAVPRSSAPTPGWPN